ncbi:MAG: NAD(P)H-dependent oxidoreductase [Alphaproteobacteria bacterium]|jgi:chromate reductase|nr:NAD(P)H-dependent oxidoreductase [Alphaproteobacteria bacterium]
MATPKILIFAGSARSASFNKKLAAAAAGMAREAGAEVTLLDLADHRLRMYDGDDEAGSGVPEDARALRRIFLAHDGLIIASPEYNSSIAPILKNTLDWISRPDGDDAMVAAYRGKVAGIMSASPGALGGLRGLVHLRSILGNIGVTMVPQQVAISGAAKAFNEDGSLADEGQAGQVKAVVDAVIRTAGALKG